VADAHGVPHALLHNLKHNKVLHERVILLTVKIKDVPYVPDENRMYVDDLGGGFHRMILAYGFMQEADVPAALKQASACGAEFKMMETSFFLVDLAYFAANLTKVPDGGWFPLLAGIAIFTLLTTWAKGRRLMVERMREGAMPIKVFIQSAASSATRVPGTAVFMTSTPDGVPHALLHNLKHNKVLHERVILLTVKIADVPFVPDEKRVKLDDLGQGFHRMLMFYGFMQEADVPAALKEAGACGTACGGTFNMMDTSFFLSRQTLLASDRPGMHIWREKLFAWMLRNAESAMEFFRLPTNRVVELGSQVEI
jgi:KUP system potassium uptake protein